MRNTLDDPKFKDLIKEDDKKKVQEIVKNVSTWLENNPNAEADEYESKKKEIEQVWTPIITAAYQGQGGGMPDMSGMPGGGNDGNNDGSGSGSGPTIDEVD
jgi:hypothetical protein